MPVAQCDQSRAIVGSATLYRAESGDRVPAPGRLAARTAHAHFLLLEQLIDERRQLVEYAARLRQFALLPRFPPLTLGAPARLPLLLEIDDGHRSALPTPTTVQFPDYNQGLTFRGTAAGGPSEAAESVGRSEPSRAVVAGQGVAHIRAAARAVAAADHVEESRRSRPVWTHAVADGRGVPRHRVHARDDRRAEARPADHEPSLEAERVVHGEPGLRIRDCGDVRDGAQIAEPVLLPARLADVRGTAAGRARPRGFRPAARAGVADQRRAADRGHELRRAGIAHAADEDAPVAVPVVARRDRDRHAGVPEVTLEELLAGELAAAAVA